MVPHAGRPDRAGQDRIPQPTQDRQRPGGPGEDGAVVPTGRISADERALEQHPPGAVDLSELVFGLEVAGEQCPHRARRDVPLPRDQDRTAWRAAEQGRVIVRVDARATQEARPDLVTARRAEQGSAPDPLRPGAVDERKARKSRSRAGPARHHRKVCRARAGEEPFEIGARHAGAVHVRNEEEGPVFGDRGPLDAAPEIDSRQARNVRVRPGEKVAVGRHQRLGVRGRERAEHEPEDHGETD
jgi:hypothetical protein